MTKSVTEALSGLDAVPWCNLKHAYGPAIDVPELIRSLASPDGSLRDKAWHEPFWDVHKSTSILRGEVSKPGFEEKLKAELECVAAAKAAINAGREIYVQQLHEIAVEPKIAAAYLLGLIGEDDGEDERELSVLEEIARSCEP